MFGEAKRETGKTSKRRARKLRKRVDHRKEADFDPHQHKPMRFEIEPKSAALNMRLPLSLLDAVKAEARPRGIPYTRYVRMLLEKAVDRTAPTKGGMRPRYG